MLLWFRSTLAPPSFSVVWKVIRSGECYTHSWIDQWMSSLTTCAVGRWDLVGGGESWPGTWPGRVRSCSDSSLLSLLPGRHRMSSFLWHRPFHPAVSTLVPVDHGQKLRAKMNLCSLKCQCPALHLSHEKVAEILTEGDKPRGWKGDFPQCHWLSLQVIRGNSVSLWAALLNSIQFNLNTTTYWVAKYVLLELGRLCGYTVQHSIHYSICSYWTLEMGVVKTAMWLKYKIYIRVWRFSTKQNVNFLTSVLCTMITYWNDSILDVFS